MPEYRYTVIIYCNDCEHKLLRDEQYKGFMDRPDVNNYPECPECESTDIKSKHVNDKNTLPDNPSPKEKSTYIESQEWGRGDMWF